MNGIKAAVVNQIDAQPQCDLVHSQDESLQQKIRLEDLTLFQTKPDKEVAKKRKMILKLYRLWNKLVPISLNKIFHDMDCDEIQKLYPDGGYWSKASLFVVASTAHSSSMWLDVQNEFHQCRDTKNFGRSTSFLSRKLCAKFEDDLNTQEVVDFSQLIANNNDDWFLLMMSIFPSVTHQWLIASNIALLKIEKSIADFYHVKFPQHLQKSVQSVVDMVQSARLYLNQGLEHLNTFGKTEEIEKKCGCLISKITQHSSTYNHHHKQPSTFNFDVMVTVVSSVLYRFLQDKQMINCVKFLKRMCWNKNSARDLRMLAANESPEKSQCQGFKSENHFAPGYWDSLPSSLFFKEQDCSGCVKCTGIQKTKDLKDAKKAFPQLTKEDLKKFISEQLIAKGRFSAADQDDLLKHADDYEIWKQFCIWYKHYDFVESSRSLHKSDQGPLSTILVLTSELEMANYEAAITERLIKWSGTKSLAVDSEGPDVSLEEMEAALLKATKMKPKGFSESLKSVGKLIKKSNKDCEKMDDNTPAKLKYQICKLLERCAQAVSAQRLIQSSCEKAGYPYKIQKGLAEVFYQWHFIQYLLPCFVASYLDLVKDSRISDTAKSFYLSFITEVITLYENEVIPAYESKATDPSMVYLQEETLCYLKWRFEIVAKELEGLLYPELEDKEQLSLITSKMQSNCFDVLTDFVGKVCNTKSNNYVHWKEQLYRFSNYLHRALWKLTHTPPGYSWKWGAELKAMSTLCRILAPEVYKGHDFKDEYDYGNARLLFCAIFKCFSKSEKSMKVKIMPGATKKETWTDLQTKVESESAKLSEHQHLALALYMCLSSTNMKNIKENKTPLLLCEAVEKTYYQIKSDKHLRVQQTLSTWQRDDQGVIQGQVSYKYAMEVAPLCYSVVTYRLTKDKKIQMKEPGEITFSPVRHCRWCGQVETEQKELFVCQFCKDIPEYPDVNLFCSLECEEKTLDQKHREEHAEMVEIALGYLDIVE